MFRKAMVDVTLADGTFLPRGTCVAAAAVPSHLNEDIYPDAVKFDAFRFSRMRSEEGEATKHQYVTTSVDYIAFGHGRHAWYVPPSTPFPGYDRFQERG